MNKKKTIPYVLYIYNSIEEEWDFISSHKKSEQKKLIHDSNRFADCYLFANSLLPSFTYISPIKIDDEFKKYFESISNSKCTILKPKEKTPFICENIVTDTDVFSTIVAEAKKAQSLHLYTYTISKNVYALKRQFEKAGVLSVILPEAPEEKNLWTAQHFGTKSGFRKSFAPLMPKGSIEYTYTAVQKNAALLFESSPAGVVLKTDKGNAGQGVHILSKKNGMTKKNLAGEIKKIFADEPFIKKHPIILEAYIDTSKEKKSPFPSVECFIHQNGKIEIPYYCNMIVTPEGEFYGMEMYTSVFTKEIKKQVLALAQTIAKTYRDLGYRGRFDIDMICDGKNVYPDESNTRTNGGTDTYLIVKKLVGGDFLSKRHVISTYSDLPDRTMRSFSRMKHLFSDYLFNPKTKTGLIINSESVIRNGGFSYILVGKNKENTKKFLSTIKTMLTNYKNKK